MEEKKPKVLIGIPTSNHKVYCLADFIVGLKKLTYTNFEILFADNSVKEENKESMADVIKRMGYKAVEIEREEFTRASIVKSRNFLRKYAIDNGFDYYLSLESDVVPPPDIIERLMERKKDIVSAVYVNGNNRVVEGKDKDGNKAIQGYYSEIPMAWGFINSELKNLEMLRPLNTQELYPSRLMEVAAVGLGCVLIKIEALKKIGKFYYEEKKFACDDMYFSLELIKNGYTLYLDTYLWCRHYHTPWQGETKEKR